MARSILILGAGSPLRHPDTVGGRAVEHLRGHYRFSPNVRIVNGGGPRFPFLDHIAAVDSLILIDAVRAGRPPGSVSRFSPLQVRSCLNAKDSLHQAALLESLAIADMFGALPHTAVVGVEPESKEPWAIDFESPLESRLDDVIALVLAEVEAAGGSYTPA